LGSAAVIKRSGIDSSAATGIAAKPASRQKTIAMLINAVTNVFFIVFSLLYYDFYLYPKAVRTATGTFFYL
jgi:hypothetical protein